MAALWPGFTVTGLDSANGPCWLVSGIEPTLCSLTVACVVGKKHPLQSGGMDFICLGITLLIIINYSWSYGQNPIGEFHSLHLLVLQHMLTLCAGRRVAIFKRVCLRNYSLMIRVFLHLICWKLIVVSVVLSSTLVYQRRPAVKPKCFIPCWIISKFLDFSKITIKISWCLWWGGSFALMTYMKVDNEPVGTHSND